MVGLRQVKAKQVQNANDQMKLSGDPEVEGKIGDQIADQLNGIGYVSRGDHEVIIDVTIEDQVYHPPDHPCDSPLINTMLLVIEVGPAERTVIYHRKEGEDDIRQ